MSLSIFKSLQSNNIEYVYIGQFTHKITDSLLSLAELNLQLINESLKIRKRVYFILVEGLQNITRHQTIIANNPEKSALLIIQRINNSYIITTANYVKNKDIENLKRNIDTINRLEGEKLKKYYRNLLEKQKISSKGGAGLGLVEIARKSNNKILYDFEKIDNDNYIFFLQTKISPSEKSNSEEIEEYKKNLKNIKQIYKKLINCNIIFSISGTFTQDKIIYMLSLLEKRFLPHKTSKNKIFNIIVELLQNIVNHADDYKIHNTEGHYGVFYIAEQDNHLLITTGNYIKNTKINRIKKLLNLINSLSIKELNQRHREFLKLFKDDAIHEKSGLGLINLRLKSKNKINYYFEKVDDEFSFLSIEVKIKKNENSKIAPLKIKSTETTPSVILNPKEAIFSFKGKCEPCDARSFFSPIHNWFAQYSVLPQNYTFITLNLESINSDCKKELIKLFQKLNEINQISVVKINYITNNEEDIESFATELKNTFPTLDIKINDN